MADMSVNMNIAPGAMSLELQKAMPKSSAPRAKVSGQPAPRSADLSVAAYILQNPPELLGLSDDSRRRLLCDYAGAHLPGSYFVHDASGEYWPVLARYEFTAHPGAILSADAERLLFVDDLDGGLALESLFASLYPPADPRLTNCRMTGSSGSLPSTVIIYDRDWYEGDDIDTLTQLAAEFKSVPFRRDQLGRGDHYGWGNPGWQPPSAWEMAERDCYRRDGTNGSLPLCIYNPKIARRRLAKWQAGRAAAVATRASRHAVTSRGHLSLCNFLSFAQALHEELDYAMPGVFHKPAEYTRTAVFTTLRHMLFVFGVIFGPRAHLQLPRFWQLRAAWRVRGEATRADYARTYKNPDWEPNLVESVFDWLDRESRRRKPAKLLGEKEHLKLAVSEQTLKKLRI